MSDETKNTPDVCWNCKGSGIMFAVDGCLVCEDEDTSVPVDYDDYDAADMDW